ncbi:MAG: hypothetical protein HQ538_01760 [Parcubacteria group bacterium]|nr:hypothetical protein [Parcubacteria group bacterium]
MKNIDTTIDTTVLKEKDLKEKKAKLNEETVRVAMDIIKILIAEEATNFEADLILKEATYQLEQCASHLPLEELTKSLFKQDEEN